MQKDSLLYAKTKNIATPHEQFSQVFYFTFSENLNFFCQRAERVEISAPFGGPYKKFFGGPFFFI
jgi:hypothetical protein